MGAKEVGVLMGEEACSGDKGFKAKEKG